MDHGSINFWLRNPDVTWTTNNIGYGFGPIHRVGVEVNVVKHTNRTLAFDISGVAGDYNLTHPIPSDSRGAVEVLLTWSPTELKLHLNGRPVQTVPRT